MRIWWTSFHVFMISSILWVDLPMSKEFDVGKNVAYIIHFYLKLSVHVFICLITQPGKSNRGWKGRLQISFSNLSIFEIEKCFILLLYMYASMTYNDKQESKVLGDLLLITLNFWTVCCYQKISELTGVVKSLKVLVGVADCSYCLVTLNWIWHG